MDTADAARMMVRNGWTGSGAPSGGMRRKRTTSSCRAGSRWRGTMTQKAPCDEPSVQGRITSSVHPSTHPLRWPHALFDDHSTTRRQIAAGVSFGQPALPPALYCGSRARHWRHRCPSVRQELLAFVMVYRGARRTTELPVLECESAPSCDWPRNAYRATTRFR